MEKQAYALVKDCKSFRVYILHFRVIAYVPNVTIKDILIQLDSEGRRGMWIVKILEYDMEIKPNKLIKRQGLAHLLLEENSKVLDLHSISYIDNHVDEHDSQVHPDYLQSE